MCRVRGKIRTLYPAELSKAETMALDIETIKPVAASMYTMVPEVRRQLTK